jgi:class II lanthipeptide synthase
MVGGVAIDYREQLAGALRATIVTSPMSFTWFGIESRPLPRAVVAALPPATTRQYLVDSLQGELYRSFYTRGRPVPARPDGGVPSRPDEAFVEALSLANAGAGGWEPGWRVEKAESDVVRVARKGLHVLARAADCRAANGRCDPGTLVSLRRPKELAACSPGYYTALGDADLAVGPDDTEVRVYFNVTAAGAAALIAMSTRMLNDAQLPFRLKVLDDPTGYVRCDAAVLYLKASGFHQARGALSSIASGCALHLRAGAPAFVWPLAPGVSLGEHRPQLGASFGTSHCRLVAEGIVAAHERGQRSLSDRLDAVAHRFAEHGLDIGVPYLTPGSSRRYAL